MVGDHNYRLRDNEESSAARSLDDANEPHRFYAADQTVDGTRGNSDASPQQEIRHQIWTVRMSEPTFRVINSFLLHTLKSRRRQLSETIDN